MIDSTEMSFGSLIDKIAQLKQLKPGRFEIDAWDEGKQFFEIDTETDMVSFSHSVMESCGCCSTIEQDKCSFDELFTSSQIEIMLDMVEKHIG